MRRTKKIKEASQSQILAIDEIKALIPFTPFFPQTNQIYLTRLKKKFEAGDSASLLEAVNCCIRSRVLIPKWVEKEWVKRFEKFNSYQVRTLDEAFEVQRKGARIDEIRSREEQKTEVLYGLFQAFTYDKYPVTVVSFEALTERFPSQSAASLQNYWYAADDKALLWRKVVALVKSKKFQTDEEIREFLMSI